VTDVSGNFRLTPQPTPAVVHTLDERKSIGQFLIRDLSQKERVTVGLKWLGAAWLVGACFLPLPIIHFVIPPLMFALGPVAFVFGFLGHRRIEEGRANCPNCNKEIVFPVARFKPEYRENCPHCNYQLRINFPEAEGLGAGSGLGFGPGSGLGSGDQK
jgi:ssDNA-binding Zn-finger/Zn-ribbon topoisomerase 1